MSRRSPILLLTMLTVGIGLAQDTVWSRRLSGTGNGHEEARKLAFAPDQGAYVVMLERPDDSTENLITARYSNSGELLWSQSLVGEMLLGDIATGPTGDVYVVGTCRRDSGLDMFVQKYSAAGDSLWLTYFTAEDNDDFAADVAVDSLGSLYVVGTSETEEGEEDIALVKFSSDGQVQWYRVYDFSGDEDLGYAVTLDPVGLVYVAGTVCNEPGTGDYDMQVLQYADDGTLGWAKSLRGPDDSDDKAHELTLDPAGDVLVAGTVIPSSTRSGYLLVKLSRAGDSLWAHVFQARGDTRPVGVVADADRNVILGVEYDVEDVDFLVIKYSPAGSELWRQSYLGPESQEILQGLAIDDLGCIYAFGELHRSRDPANYALATVKYSPTGESLWTRLWSHRVEYVVRFGSASVVADTDVVYVCGFWELRNRDQSAVVVAYEPEGDVRWSRQYCSPGPSLDKAYAVAIDSAGDILAAGQLDVTGEAWDFAVARYGPAGQLRWLHTYGLEPSRDDVGLAVGTDALGNVYAAGYSECDTTGYDYVVLKLDPDGNRLWADRYDGPAHGDDVPVALAVDVSGSVVVTGTSPGTGTDSDIATVRYSSDGTRQWVRRHNGSADTTDLAVDVVVDDSCCAYVVGRTEEAGRINAATLVKYDDSGNPVWVVRCYVPTSPYGSFYVTDVALGPEGECYLGGSGVWVDSYWFLGARISRAGETLWVREAPVEDGCQGRAATAGCDGRLYVAGQSWVDEDFRVALVAFDSTGEQLWRVTGDSGTANAVTVAPGGIAYVTGRDWYGSLLSLGYDPESRLVWQSRVQLGAQWWGEGFDIALYQGSRVVVAGTGGPSYGERDFTLVMFEPVIGIAAPRRPGTPGSGISVWPNPSSGAGPVVVRLTAPMAGACDAEIRDILGRTVYRCRLGEDPDAGPGFTWYGQDRRGNTVPAGVYFVHLNLPNKGRAEALGRTRPVKIVRLQ